MNLAVRASLEQMNAELVQVRRDIHRNPELAWQETRTTALVAQRLSDAGLSVCSLGPSGCYADLGASHPRVRVALRADLDALPVQERTGLPWASRTAGVSHACGHDVHTTAVLGAGLALQLNRDALRALGLGVRLIFQPAEEVMPGGGHALATGPALAGIDHALALHCDPHRDVGAVGLKVGAITAAADAITVRLRGTGGHTSRPHLTSDLTYALAKVVTDVPAALSRRVDPRSGVALVWGAIRAGTVPNIIPDHGEVLGTVRVLDASAWAGMSALIRQLVDEVVAPYGASVDVEYAQGVPPVVNSRESVGLFASATRAMVGPDAVVPAEQSLGGEDFGWLLQHCSGAMARLGTRTPGGRSYDLHQGDFTVDERAIGIGAGVLAGAALAAAQPPS